MSPDEQLRAIADAADALARLARAALEARPLDSASLLPIKTAAQRAATSPRVVTEAIRAGVLPAYGGQRDRAVRLSDLDAWIESRRRDRLDNAPGKSAHPYDTDPVYRADIDRRMRNIAARERAAARRSSAAPATPRSRGD